MGKLSPTRALHTQIGTPFNASSGTDVLLQKIDAMRDEAVASAESAALSASAASSAVSSGIAGHISDPDPHPQYLTASEGNSTYAPASHATRSDNPHSVTKAQVGLGNVDNTSDDSKPVSSATAAALAGKSDSSHTHAVDALSGTAGLARYSGQGPVYPVVSDTAGRVLIGIDKATSKVTVSGFADKTLLTSPIFLELHGDGARVFTGTGDVLPILADSEGRVLVGYDKANNSIVGGQSVPQRQALSDLATADKPQARDYNHFLLYGQSNAVGASGQAAISTSQPYSNVTFTGGPKSTKAGGTGWNAGLGGFKPLVEDNLTGDYEINSARGETACSGTANGATRLRAIEDGASPSSHVILASTAGHGGYSISQLRKGSTDVTHDSTNTVVSPTNWYGVLLDQVNAAKTLAGASTYALHLVGWLQGESDQFTAGYAASLAALRAEIQTDVQGITAQTHPVYMATYQPSWGAAVAGSLIQKALLQATEDDSRILFAAPTHFMPTADGIHLTNVGHCWMGHYFGRIYKQLLAGKRPKWVRPLSATAKGTALSIKFDVPVLPLRFDSTTLKVTTDKGFLVKDDTGTLTLSSITISGGDTVKITLNRTLGANPVVRYALDYAGAGIGWTNGASGQLCDSETDAVDISGVTRPLFNAAPHFEKSIIILG